MLASTASCATAPVPVPLEGLELANCTGLPNELSDADMAALFEQMPTADQREKEFWTPRAWALRRFGLCERDRADNALAAIERFNQLARQP